MILSDANGPHIGSSHHFRSGSAPGSPHISKTNHQASTISVPLNLCRRRSDRAAGEDKVLFGDIRVFDGERVILSNARGPID